jgi:hypothetical protein
LLNEYAAFPSAAGAIAGANLPVADPTGGGSFVFASAEAKALGLISDNLNTDGIFTFSNSAPYTFDPNNRAVPGAFDWIGIAEHEVSEIMGRISILGSNFGAGNSYDPNDLFRFVAPGVRNLAFGGNGNYLSIDNGNSVVPPLNDNPGGDMADYSGANPGDPYNAFTGPGQAHALTQADVTNLEAIGYGPSQQQATPEPATLTLLVIGCAGLTGYSWRRRSRASQA